jgi:signal transduction histidine kinase
LGTLSGFLAGFLYLAISIPLVLSAIDAEEFLAIRQSKVATSTAERWLTAGTVLTEARVEQLGVSWLSATTANNKSLYRLGQPDPEVMGSAACAQGAGDRLVAVGGQTWATSCLITPDLRVATGVVPEHMIGRQILYWTFMLAVIVGVVTALGQALLLRPLGQMSRALERVGAGERGVRLQSIGLAELDDVVDRINETAIHVEERVDAISARITVVQEMARLVAHEVRNPLQSLELLTSLIATEDDRTERQDIANSIRDEIRALDQVVHRLLREGASRGALRLRLQRQSIGPMIEQVTRVHRLEAERCGVRLSVGLVSLREVAVDGAMLGRSIENLAINALQAVPKGTGEVRLSVFEEDSWLCVATDDNGPGVDPKLGDTIFDVDVTGKPSGHGLGLALVHAVLVAHGGNIEYSTSTLGGARFLARIPLNDDMSRADGEVA